MEKIHKLNFLVNNNIVIYFLNFLLINKKSLKEFFFMAHILLRWS